MLATSLALGIAVGYFVYMKNYLMLTLFCIGYFACLVYFCIYSSKINKTRISLYFSIVFIAFSVFGYLGFHFNTYAYDNVKLYSGTYTVTGRIVKVDFTDTGNRYLLDDITFTSGDSANFKLELNVVGKANFDLGDVIRFSSEINDKSSVYEEKYLASYVSERIKFYSSVYSDEIEFINSSPTIYQKINLKIRDVLQENLDANVFAVAYALLTGGDEYIPENVISTFRNTGVAHIFAVSGLHIGFLAYILSVVQKKIKIKGIVKVLFSAIILFGYSGVCGFSSSSIRACIMSTVMSFLSLFGERYDGISSISIACIIILIFSPVQLLCVGFQLSFSVALGILIVAPAIKRTLSKLPNNIASALSTVFAAQLVSIPILLYSFGHFSIVSIMVNLLFIPVVGVIYVILFVCTLLTIIFGSGNIFLFIPNYALKLLTILINFFDKDFFIVGGITFGGFVILYYLVCFVFSGIFNLKRVTSLILCSVLSLTCILGVVVKTYATNSYGIYVSGSESFSFTFISKNTGNTLVVSDVKDVFSLGRLKRLKENENLDKLNTIVLMNGNSDVDIYNVIGEIYSVYNFDIVLYYGETNFELETIVKKTFPDVHLSAFLDGRIGVISGDDYVSLKNGKCLSFNFEDKNVSIFSPFNKETPDVLGLIPNPDLIICYDYVMTISAVYRNSEIISYRPNLGFNDAESKGNIKYNLS